MAAAGEREKYPPGQSPFHMKGSVYRHLFDWIEKMVPGGTAGFVQELPDAPLRAFAAERFLASSWYDVLPIARLFQALAQKRRQALADTIREVIGDQAQKDINGIYRMLLHLSSPAAVIERIPRVATQYFDFVSSTVEKLSPRSYRVVGEGVPEFVAAVYMAVTETFLLRAMTLSGAKDARCRWDAPAAAGAKHGLMVVRLSRTLEWL